MGTQQVLTTQQVEFLILVGEIESYKKQSEEEIDPSNKEIITQDGYMSVEDVEEIAERLTYYGYLGDPDSDDEYSLTIDGKQYIDLFKEYLIKKSENPTIVNNTYSLINIDQLKISLEACVAKLSSIENLINLKNSINLKNIINLLGLSKG